MNTGPWKRPGRQIEIYFPGDGLYNLPKQYPLDKGGCFMKRAMAVLLIAVLFLAMVPAFAEEKAAEGEETSQLPDAGSFGDIGTVILFGNFEQDGDEENGPEPIEWIVSDQKDGKTLLVSKYALDARAYNTDPGAVTWEDCTLREWLNNDFLNIAFNENELKYIRVTEVDNSREQGFSEYSSDGGNNTQDRIFLLSYHEAFDLCFANDESRMCAPTDLAMNHGGDHSGYYLTEEGRDAGEWWLRSPGYNQDMAMLVSRDGTKHQMYVEIAMKNVRPAMWVDVWDRLE